MVRAIWISANRFGYELLKEARKLRGLEIVAIVTLESKSETIMYDGIPTDKWDKFGIDVFRVKQLEESKWLIRKLSPDLIVVCGWRQLISKDIISIAGKGVIGFHPTLLPYGRGAAPLINTILKGDRVSGLTMFYINEGIDSGDIIAQKRFIIGRQDHAQEVYNKVIRTGRSLIRQYLPEVLKGDCQRSVQHNSRAVRFKKPVFKDNRIDFDKESLETIFRKIKALSRPYRGAYVEKDGQRLIIWRAELKEAQ